MDQTHAPLRKVLQALNIELPAPAAPAGSYVPVKRVANLIFVSGQLPTKDGSMLATGPVPANCSIDQAKKAARQCVINALAAVQTLGPDALDKLRGVVRVGCFVSSEDGFTAQPQVANGASDFLIELFGDAGRHVRAAVGVNTLPLDASVEVELIFETA